MIAVCIHKHCFTSSVHLGLCEPECGPRRRLAPFLPRQSATLPNVIRTFASPVARGLGLFLFRRPLNKTTTSLWNKYPKDTRKMAHITGPAMSYSSMKGRLHDGLLKGLEVMGYE